MNYEIKLSEGQIWWIIRDESAIDLRKDEKKKGREERRERWGKGPFYTTFDYLVYDEESAGCGISCWRCDGVYDGQNGVLVKQRC